MKNSRALLRQTTFAPMNPVKSTPKSTMWKARGARSKGSLAASGRFCGRLVALATVCNSSEGMVSSSFSG